MSHHDEVAEHMASLPPAKRSDSREGFSTGDPVKHTAPPHKNLSDEGIVQGWIPLEHAPDVWHCVVTWGGRYTGVHETYQLAHADRTG